MLMGVSNVQPVVWSMMSDVGSILHPWTPESPKNSWSPCNARAGWKSVCPQPRTAARSNKKPSFHTQEQGSRGSAGIPLRHHHVARCPPALGEVGAGLGRSGAEKWAQRARARALGMPRWEKLPGSCLGLHDGTGFTVWWLKGSWLWNCLCDEIVIGYDLGTK